MFYYEGRTIRGLGLIGWALWIQLGAVVAMGATLATLALVVGPALADPPAFVTAFQGILAAVCGIELGEVAMVVVFLVGFHHLHAGRHEYGFEHARSLDRAVLFLALFAALSLVSAAYTIASSLFTPSIGGSPTEPLLVGNIVLAPVEACFAGLVLVYSARSLAEPPERRRLISAWVLGIVGAAAGPVLLTLATAADPRDLSGIVEGFLSSAVAGNGMAALSLLVFILVLRDLRRDLIGGRLAPVLPRIDQVYPWLAAPPVGVREPGPREPFRAPGD